MIQSDMVIVGAGAAGLAAAIFAGEAAASLSDPPRIVLLDGARKPGAKILVSGGGRCNVTHQRVTPDDFWGGPRPVIRNVLRAFDETATLQWMERLGVRLKLEPSGKYFPVTDQSRSVLDALTRRTREVGIEYRTQTRVTGIRVTPEGFSLAVSGKANSVSTRRLVIATGGRSLPKSGSDGAGLEMLRALGHTLVPPTPALVPLVLRPGHDVGGRFAEFAGITLPMRLGLYTETGRKVIERTDSLLFTHFGISGPLALDFSRHWLRARLESPDETFHVALGHPELDTIEKAEGWILDQAASHPKRSVSTVLSDLFPGRIARTMGEDLDPDASRGASGDDPPIGQLTKKERKILARRMARLPIRILGDRGYAFAETTAGGVDLRTIDPRTMESRVCPGLYLCGELLDVDGRIGGFNFQWAWTTGYLAGRAAVRSLSVPAPQ